MKVILIGIFFLCLNTLFGSSFDSITKYLSINSLKWFHFYSIGGTFALLIYFLILHFFGGIRKHIILKEKKN